MACEKAVPEHKVNQLYVGHIPSEAEHLFPVTWNIGCWWHSAKDSHLAQWLNNVEVRSYKCPDPFSPSNTTLKGLPTQNYSQNQLCPSAQSYFPHSLHICWYQEHSQHTSCKPIFISNLWNQNRGRRYLGSRLPYLRPWISWFYEPINFLLLLKLFSFTFLSLSSKEMWLMVTPQLQVSESQRNFCTFI